MLTPEQQLQNVASLMLEETEVKRQYNGKGRTATYSANVDAIAGTGRQLAEMIIAYLDGKLQPVDESELF